LKKCKNGGNEELRRGTIGEEQLRAIKMFRSNKRFSENKTRVSLKNKYELGVRGSSLFLLNNYTGV